MLSTTDNIERAGYSRKSYPQMNANQRKSVAIGLPSSLVLNPKAFIVDDIEFKAVLDDYYRNHSHRFDT